MRCAYFWHALWSSPVNRPLQLRQAIATANAKVEDQSSKAKKAQQAMEQAEAGYWQRLVRKSLHFSCSWKDQNLQNITSISRTKYNQQQNSHTLHLWLSQAAKAQALEEALTARKVAEDAKVAEHQALSEMRRDAARFWFPFFLALCLSWSFYSDKTTFETFWKDKKIGNFWNWMRDQKSGMLRNVRNEESLWVWRKPCGSTFWNR